MCFYVGSHVGEDELVPDRLCDGQEDTIEHVSTHAALILGEVVAVRRCEVALEAAQRLQALRPISPRPRQGAGTTERGVRMRPSRFTGTSDSGSIQEALAAAIEHAKQQLGSDFVY